MVKLFIILDMGWGDKLFKMKINSSVKIKNMFNFFFFEFEFYWK